MFRVKLRAEYQKHIFINRPPEVWQTGSEHDLWRIGATADTSIGSIGTDSDDWSTARYEYWNIGIGYMEYW